MSSAARRSLLLLLAPLLLGCDRLADLLELPDPQKEALVADAEGRAIGSACRHAGRSLEDCYVLNPKAQKAAVFAGWREMNDYMMEHKLQDVPSQLVPQPAKTSPADEGEDAPAIVPGMPFTPIKPSAS
ncbi:hypothetical protein [Pseudothauera rhizosphaerae]|uniref:Uncharacterized protein n=1 Tax=Pseudothauera rhizosphaerae TaxID=2565932 RepID=A0A4S4AN16_9RHOO|nr:hypothetical protein [Pseudothauera rhizosphaerae]THF60466.1 hypothetical protein E6O51_13390 [Pseudothauera rhizosphaerae]